MFDYLRGKKFALFSQKSFGFFHLESVECFLLVRESATLNFLILFLASESWYELCCWRRNAGSLKTPKLAMNERFSRDSNQNFFRIKGLFLPAVSKSETYCFYWTARFEIDWFCSSHCNCDGPEGSKVCSHYCFISIFTIIFFRQYKLDFIFERLYRKF